MMWMMSFTIVIKAGYSSLTISQPRSFSRLTVTVLLLGNDLDVKILNGAFFRRCHGITSLSVHNVYIL